MAAGAASSGEQLKSAQDSALGVNIGSSTISAIGQADDVILAADNLDSLRYLARLTERYCANFRVKLVASKTKLLPVYKPKHENLVEYAKLVNSVKIDETAVQFVKEADHVGVLRSCHGNMPNILNRIACHKKALGSVSPAGLARSHRGNPSASLRVHQLYAAPVLLCGLGSLYITEAEMKVLDGHYKNSFQNLQRLHQNTPRGVVFMLAGCLPCRALVHIRQLSLFLMLCHLPSDPLNVHARHILQNAPQSARSWFQQVKDLCSMYDLASPLELLDTPPHKKQFKVRVQKNVAAYWHQVLSCEIKKLKSLKYFKPELYSLTRPHYMWTSAASNSFECSKSTVLARMASGRFRTDMMTRYWSQNRSGYCRQATCVQVQGTLEHLLTTCLALSSIRENMYQMWLERSVMFPSLHATIRAILSSHTDNIVQFVLEPLALPGILEDVRTHGDHFIQLISYMTRTFAFYMNKYSKQLQDQQSPNNPPITYDINSSVSGPEGSRNDHPVPLNSKHGPGYLPSSDDWPQNRVCSTVTTSHTDTTLPGVGGQSEGEDRTSSVLIMLCSNQSPSTMTENHGWVPLLGRAASTQHIFNFIKETNNNSSLHDHRLDPEAVCVGVGSALLVSSPKLSHRVEHGWHGDGVRCVGGGCCRDCGWACSEVPDSCTMP